jgi:NADPH:quinone reductase-like Zn-dependent oxidoreductase
MKAIIHTQYGPPEVAQLKDIPKPLPKENELLVKVYASTVNRTDSGFRSAEYVISRFWSGLLKPKQQTLGSEFSGVVEAVGAQVREFKIGDNVFGFNDKQFGGHAEYLTIAASAGVALMPDNVNFETAAAISEGAHYALVDIYAAKVSVGQHVMVYGATGAIGSTAVQLLKHFGAIVTAVCNTKNVDLVKSLGADVVIDYQTQDYKQVNQKFDLIFDAVGKSSFGECKPLLKEKGIYISTELGKNGENILYALTSKFSSGKKLLFPIPLTKKEDIEFLRDLVQQNKFKPVIDRTYTLEQIVEAYKYVESGQKTGNVVLKIAES